MAQQAARWMLHRAPARSSSPALRPASKAMLSSAPFAMGKFALRGLAQSMARELSPQNIHVAHFVIDGVVRRAGRPEPPDRPDSMLDPDAIAGPTCRPRPAAQRLDLGGRAASLGRDLLTIGNLSRRWGVLSPELIISSGRAHRMLGTILLIILILLLLGALPTWPHNSRPNGWRLPSLSVTHGPYDPDQRRQVRMISAKEPARKIPRDVNEAARDLARGLMQTEGYRVSARQRKMIETGFGDMKRNLGLTRLRLRGLAGANDEFLLAATVQNLRRIAKAIWRSPEPTTSPTTA